MSDAIADLDIASWTGPFDAERQDTAAAALEGGRVLRFPLLPFVIEERERWLLDPAILSGKRKNVSLDPATGAIGGSSLEGEKAAVLAAMMERFAVQATALVVALFPGYPATLERARTSFRPAPVEGRAQSPRHDDRLLHVDAFPTRPMPGGRRILRVFSNVAPDGAHREWHVGEPFEDFARAFLPRLKPPLPGADLAMSLLGLTRGRRRPYDRIMLGLHDAGKLDGAYQGSCRKTEASFPPGSSWMVFTDQVLHAAIGGHLALEQTFHLPVDAQAHPDQSPIRVLERLTGRSLA